MKSDFGSANKLEIFDVIQEEGLETFKSAQVWRSDSIDLSTRMVNEYLTEMAEELEFMEKVDNHPSVYSFNGYQAHESLEDLDLISRVAVDELVQSIREEKLLDKSDISGLVEGYFDDYQKVGRLQKTSSVVYSFRDLPFVNYDAVNESYRLEEL